MQEMLALERKSKSGEISSKELYESYEPLICELTHMLHLSNIETNRLQDEVKSNVESTRATLEEIQTYDMAVRASYNFVIDKGYEEEFKVYFNNNLDDAAAKIRRSEFELVKPN
jgi:hypothetical protein